MNPNIGSVNGAEFFPAPMYPSRHDLLLVRCEYPFVPPLCRTLEDSGLAHIALEIVLKSAPVGQARVAPEVPHSLITLLSLSPSQAAHLCAIEYMDPTAYGTCAAAGCGVERHKGHSHPC